MRSRTWRSRTRSTSLFLTSHANCQNLGLCQIFSWCGFFSSSLFPSLFGRDKQVWYHSRGTERGNTAKASSSSRTCHLSPILIRIVEAKQPCGCINCIISHQKDVKNVPLQFFDFPSFFAQWRDGAGLFCACAQADEKRKNKQITDYTVYTYYRNVKKTNTV